MTDQLTGTRYTKGKRKIADYPFKLLKHPKSDNKIGQRVTRGQFKGYKVFSLTLEERATCPTSCQRWLDCYGNNMPFAHRLEHGFELEQRLAVEVPELCKKNTGVLIRLHVLGDFYSVDYVRLWERLLSMYPNLAIWGYTHRNNAACPIRAEIIGTRTKHGMRFAIRHSDAPSFKFSANHETIKTNKQDITCPEQLNKTASCATCGLCWAQTKRPIKFLAH